MIIAFHISLRSLTSPQNPKHLSGGEKVTPTNADKCYQHRRMLLALFDITLHHEREN